jgi:hypothetical protein
LAERIGTIKARGRKPGKQKAGKHRVTESTEPGKQKAGKHRVTESTEPGRQKAGKAESRESIRPGNTESQRTQREKSRWWGHVWEMANPAKTCNGRFWMLPYQGGCKRRKGRKFLGNVGFSTFNPCDYPFVRNL